MAKSVEINGEFEWETHVFQDDDPEQRTIIGRLRDGTTIKGKARVCDAARTTKVIFRRKEILR
jgi:hypothetical protein